MAKDKKAAKELTIEEKLAQALVPVEEQPYKIPKNWCWTYMGIVAQWGSGGTPSRKKPEYYEGRIPWVKTGELNNEYIYDTEEKITNEAVANSSAKLFPVNTVVIAMYGATIGKVGILGIEAATNQACACGVCSNGLNYKYLFYYAYFQKNVFIRMAKGGAQPNISQDIIKNYPIPIPPLDEQIRTINCIESIFSKLDEAKEKAQAVVDGFELRKSAILYKAFTGELTKQWREEHGLTLESWKNTKLGDTIRLLSGQDYKPEQYNNKNDGVPYITGASNFDETHVVINRWTPVPSVIAKKGDILLVCKGSGYGKTIIADFDKAHIARQIMAIRTNDNIINEYLLFYFRTQYEYFRNNGQGLIPGISRKVVLEMQVRIPTKNEQVYMVEQVKSIFNKEILAREAAKKVIDQIGIIKQAVLARAFHGELGTNDLTEEAAIELLKLVL